MKLSLDVSFPDHPERESYTVVADSRDQLKWERAKKGRALGNLLALSVMGEDLYALAHVASQRVGKYPGELAAFEVEAVVEMGLRDSSDDTPTNEGPSAAGS